MRQKLKISALTVFWLLSLAVSPLFAQEELEETQEATEATEAIENTAEKIDAEASTQQGAKVVEQKIKDQFNVEDSTIQNLREKGLGYGEITTALSLAERLEGGLNEENIQKISNMRIGNDKKGWGEIAKQFDVTVGDLKRNVQSVQESAPVSVTKDSPAKREKFESPAADRSERPNRPNPPGKNK